MAVCMQKCVYMYVGCAQRSRKPLSLVGTHESVTKQVGIQPGLTPSLPRESFLHQELLKDRNYSELQQQKEAPARLCLALLCSL